jgi:four helix bundle protein
MRNGEQEPEDLRDRTKRFALRVIRLYSALPRDRDCASRVLGKQMLRSGTSVAAQYREACRARSTAEFVSKLEAATQDRDETNLWFELLVESGLVPSEKLSSLQAEGSELLAILIASARTAKSR